MASSNLPSLNNYQRINTFTPLPWQVEPFHDLSEVLLLTGSAGGGKSRLACEKLHAFLLRYPEATGLMLRKSRASLNKSVLLQYKQIVGRDPRVQHRPSEHRFDYYNGSVLVYGGMKDEAQRESIRSVGPKGGVDIAWMEEATQFVEADYNEVSARMRGNAAPWRQVILSTNPHGPAHWINVRLILGGEASVYYSKARDNIYNPTDYADKKLARLSGVERKRLAEGLWVAGEGVVFDTYLDDYNGQTGKDYGGNVTLEAEYQEGAGPVVWAIDDGYAGRMDENTRMFTGKSHPRAILFVQKRYDGRLAVFAESFKIQTLATEHVNEMKQVSLDRGWPLPEYVVQDRAAAALVGVLENAGLEPLFNRMAVDESIKVVREMLSVDYNNFRRILIHPRCTYLRYQMQTYSYDDSGNVVKEHDDGCFVAGTRVLTPRGLRPIESIVAGDLVLTRLGARVVTDAAMTGKKPIYSIEFGDGGKLEGTGDHPVMTPAGYVRLDSLLPGDTILVSQYIRSKEWAKQLTRWFTGELSFACTRATGITSAVVSTLKTVFAASTERFTRIIMGQSRPAGTSIMPMATTLTTTPTTWLPSKEASTYPCTAKRWTRKPLVETLPKPGRQPKNGTEARPAEPGTGNTPSGYGRIWSQSLAFASAVAELTRPSSRAGIGIAQPTVELPPGAPAGLMTKIGLVLFAPLRFVLIATAGRRVAPCRVRRVYEKGISEPVYNLTVDGEHEYFAAGVLVSNCDALRYLCWQEEFAGTGEIDVATWSDVR